MFTFEGFQKSVYLHVFAVVTISCWEARADGCCWAQWTRGKEKHFNMAAAVASLPAAALPVRLAVVALRNALTQGRFGLPKRYLTRFNVTNYHLNIWRNLTKIIALFINKLVVCFDSAQSLGFGFIYWGNFGPSVTKIHDYSLTIVWLLWVYYRKIQT